MIGTTRIRCTFRIVAAALLAAAPATGLVPSVARAQTTTAPASRPSLFTWNDALLAGVFVVGTIAAYPLDKHLAHRFRDPGAQENRFANDLATTVRDIAEPGSTIIGLGMYTYGRLAHNQKAADLGWHGTEAIIVGSLFADVIKNTAGRARPFVTADSNPADWQVGRGLRQGDRYRSFPSGHTVAAFAAAAAVANETSRWWPRSVWYVGPAMYGGAALVGLSRMYNDRHWASDVIMGAAIGTFAGNKVVRYSHRTSPGNRLDRWILGAQLSPTPNGMAVSWSVGPGMP